MSLPAAYKATAVPDPTYFAGVQFIHFPLGLRVVALARPNGSALLQGLAPSLQAVQARR